MDVLLALSIFWIGYGVAGILGFQVIPKKYKGKDWTKNYIRHRGISWLLIGIPELVLCLINIEQIFSHTVVVILIILCSVPSIIYSIIRNAEYYQNIKQVENDI